MNDKAINRIIIRKIVQFILISLLVLPVLVLLVMKVGWWMEPNKELSMILVNKSVNSTDGREHSALFWLLENQKYERPDGTPFSPAKDYLGIFPSGNGKFHIRDFETIDHAEVNRLSRTTDLVYYIDTYGVYGEPLKEEDKQETEVPGLIYGGMSRNDIEFLKNAKQRGKSIVAEFNILGLPTHTEVRRSFEREFGVEWTGWAGKYYVLLDKNSGALPSWLVAGYEKQNGQKWNFKTPGVVFTHEDGRILVLAEGEDLHKALPVIHTFGYGCDSLGMVKTIGFEHWFDVMRYNDSINHAISAFELNVTDKGREQLTRNGLPLRFPAVIMHHEADYRFYYLCGDYGNRQIVPLLTRFKGSYHMERFFRDRNNIRGGDDLFYRFYVPLLSGVIKRSHQTRRNELSENKQILHRKILDRKTRRKLMIILKQ